MQCSLAHISMFLQLISSHFSVTGLFFQLFIDDTTYMKCTMRNRDKEVMERDGEKETNIRRNYEKE